MKKAILTSLAIMLSANTFAERGPHHIDRMAEKLDLNEKQVQILREDFEQRKIERKAKKEKLIEKLELTPEQEKKFEKFQKKKKHFKEKHWHKYEEYNKEGMRSERKKHHRKRQKEDHYYDDDEEY